METILERAYRLQADGDDMSALSVILDETEKLISLGLLCVAKQFADSVDIDKVKLTKHAHRFKMLRTELQAAKRQGGEQ